MGVTLSEIIPFGLAAIIFTVLALFFRKLSDKLWFLNKLVSPPESENQLKKD